jgi:DNA-binding GntR family transcriptional regulator
LPSTSLIYCRPIIRAMFTRLLEPVAAALAAQRASRKEVALLRKSLESFKENLAKENLVGLIRADIQFHRLVPTPPRTGPLRSS